MFLQAWKEGQNVSAFIDSLQMEAAFLLIKERSTRIKTEISFMAGQPTPPKKKKRTPLRIRPYQGPINHWFPLIRPGLIKAMTVASEDYLNLLQVLQNTRTLGKKKV